MKRLVTFLSIAYLAVLLLLWWMVACERVATLPNTLLHFSPRWVIAMPILVLIPITTIFRKRLVWVYLVHVVIILFPLLGLKWNATKKPIASSSVSLRVLTANLGGGTIDVEALTSLIRSERIKIALFQECSATESKEIFRELGWKYQQYGQVAIGTEFPIAQQGEETPQASTRYADPSAIICRINLDDGSDVRLVSVHLPTFRPALEALRQLDADSGPDAFAKMAEKYRSAASRLARALEDNPAQTILGGDFNVPAESRFYRDYWDEYTNAFGESGNGFGHTKFTRWHGVRIDHILSSKEWAPRQCLVGPDIGGDHRPVIAELLRVVKP